MQVHTVACVHVPLSDGRQRLSRPRGQVGGLAAPGLSCLCAPGQAVESVQAEDESAQLCKRRIEHLKEHSSDQPAAAGLWKRKRMDRMMAEHLLRCGYYNTAVKLARQSGIEVGAAAGRGSAGQARVQRSVPGWAPVREPRGPRPGCVLRPGGRWLCGRAAPRGQGAWPGGVGFLDSLPFFSTDLSPSSGLFSWDHQLCCGAVVPLASVHHGGLTAFRAAWATVSAPTPCSVLVQI